MTTPDSGDNPKICYCMKVHEEALLAAIAAGAHGLEDLMARTRAGTGCGTCRSELLTLLRKAATNPTLKA